MSDVRPDAVKRLKELEPELRAQGIGALYLFGSCARGEATDESDVDLAFDVLPGRRFSLFDQARVMRELSETLCSKVDFVPRNELHPCIRAGIEAEQIKVFG